MLKSDTPLVFPSLLKPKAHRPWRGKASLHGWLGAALVAGALLFGGAVEAQESEGEDSAEVQTEQGRWTVEDEVFVEGAPPAIPTSNTVAAKLPLSLLETPASVSVVGLDTLADQQAFVLGDALQNLAGVNVQTGSGVFDFFVIRGLDSVSSGLILTDGAPEPETTFYQLYNVDRVEVFRGPTAFLYGGSPLGGTVNLVRKQPQGANFTTLGLSAGSFSTFEATVDTNWVREDGRVQTRINGLWQESDNFRDDKDSSNFAINPAITWRPSDTLSVNFNLERVETEYKSDSGLPLLLDGSVADVPRERSYQSPFDISDQEITRFQVDVESRRSESFTLRNKTYYRQLTWDSQGTIFNGVFPSFTTGRLEVNRSLLQLDDEQTFYGNQLEGLWQLETGEVTHNLLVGAEITRQLDEFTFDVGLLPTIDLLNPVETAAEPVFLIPGQSFAADADTTVLALYAVDQIALSDRLQVLLGLRFDAIDFSDDVNGEDRSEDEVSPMAGLVFTPNEATSLYASWGQAFAPQSTFVVGEERVPEESDQIELGVKRSFAEGRGQASLSVYRIDRENIAIPDATGVLRQIGSQRSEGLELEITGDLGGGVRGSFAWAYNDAELTEFTEQLLISFFPPAFLTLDYAGNTAPFSPEHLGSLWLTKDFSGGFGLGLGARYVDEQFIAENNAFAIDSYTTLDAVAYYDWSRIRLQVNLKNLTDEDFFTRGFGSSSVIPAAGFAAYTSLRLRF
ncbi:MAG: TonB-dependent siderophore receptor [Acidobacteriota bacterium]